MTGPVAAARPFLLRPGSKSLLFKQLSGPAATGRIAPRPFRPSTSTSTSFSTVLTGSNASSRSGRPLSICLECRHQSRVRLYSTTPPDQPSSSSKEDPSKPPSTPNGSAVETGQPPPPPSSSSSPSSTRSSGPSGPSGSSSSSPRRNEPNEPELPSQTDSRRSALSQNVSHLMDNFQSRVLVASQTLNDLTGYSAIERIKHANARLETDLAAAQETLRRARTHYKAVNQRRAATQREVTALLARKDTWSPADLERFTSLYRQDHELESAVSDAAAALTDAEADEARLSQALNSGILKRYHEEQIWSDRIRRQSTWGTWGLMGVNFLLFVVIQFVAEPWKRNRLMKGIAAEEKAALEAVRRELEEVRGALARRDRAEADAADAFAASAAADAAAAAAAAAAAEEQGEQGEQGEATAPVATTASVPEPTPLAPPKVSWAEFLSDPNLWGPAAQDLISERRIYLRMWDASLLALEGAVTGAAVVASVVLVLHRRG